MLALPPGMGLKERKTLSLRCKVFLIMQLTLLLTLGNAYLLLFLAIVPRHPCQFALYLSATDCHKVDFVGVVALIGGALSIFIFLWDIYKLVSTKLYLRPGEQDTPCFVKNVTPWHNKANLKCAKACGVLLLLLEVVVASYNLSPWLYLAAFIPTVLLASYSANWYLKV